MHRLGAVTLMHAFGAVIIRCNIGTSNSVTMRYEQKRKTKQAQETTKKAQRRERETTREVNYHAQAR